MCTRVVLVGKRSAARALVDEAEKYLPSLSGPGAIPAAKSGEVVFCLRTPRGVFSVVDSQSSMADEKHARASLYARANDLMTAFFVHGTPLEVFLHADGGLMIADGNNPDPTWCTRDQLKGWLKATTPSQARRVLHAPTQGGKAFEAIVSLFRGDKRWQHGDVPEAWPEGMSSLHRAIAGKRLDIVSDLIARGADIKATADHGYDALLIACYLGTAPIVEAVLAAGGDPNRRDTDGNTPLMFAAQRQDEVSVRALLRAGADPRARGERGFTALQIAEQYPNNPAIPILRKALAGK
jgi:hypothetical protein